MPGTMCGVRSNTTAIEGDVKDLGLAKEGQGLIDWAAREMPVLLLIRDRFRDEKQLEGLRVSACLHSVASAERPGRSLKSPV